MYHDWAFDAFLVLIGIGVALGGGALFISAIRGDRP